MCLPIQSLQVFPEHSDANTQHKGGWTVCRYKQITFNQRDSLQTAVTVQKSNTLTKSF